MKTTMMISEGTLALLYELIRTSEDSRNGFAQATKAAVRPELKTLFHILSIDRNAAAAELQGVLLRLGFASADPDAATNASAWSKRLHNEADTEVAMLEDIDLSEQDASARYARTLSTELPACIRRVVQKQYDDGLRSRDLIRGLRSRHGPSKAWI